MRKWLIIVFSVITTLFLGMVVCNASPFSSGDPFAHVKWRLPTDAELIESIGYLPDISVAVLDRIENLVVFFITLNIIVWYVILLSFICHNLIEIMLHVFKLRRVQPKTIKKWHYRTILRKASFINMCVSYFLLAIYNSFSYKYLTLDVYGLDRTIPFVIDINLWVFVVFLCIFAIVLLCKYVLGRPKFAIWLLLLLIILSCVINMRDVLIPLLTLWSR